MAWQDGAAGWRGRIVWQDGTVGWYSRMVWQDSRTVGQQDGCRAGNPILIKELYIVVPSEKVLVSSLGCAGANTNLYQHSSPLLTFNP